MDFSRRQADPRRHLVGITFVIAFHAFIVYALVTGLAKKVVEVVRAPIETKVIEEVKKPPPPPEVAVPPPPKMEAPPPPFIPPPEVQIATPPPAPTITATTPTPPPAPVVIAPTPPTPAPAPRPAPTGPVMAAVVCTKLVQPQPPVVRDAMQATILVNFAIQGGKVSKVEVLRQSFQGTTDRRIQRQFIANIESAMQQYVCPGDHPSVQQEFVFTIN